MNSTYLIDEYVKTEPGQPFRLFPFGDVVKGGRKHTITPELARRFRLPHYKPAIKLGSHRDETPAGGHIIGLEVRDDGLYAIPEVTPKGAAAIADGNFRYNSPEVIWEDAGLEDPKTGNIIEGPLIVGAALLHDPHLGETTALYSVDKSVPKENPMTDEYVQVDKGLWATIQERLFKSAPEDAPQPEPAPVVETDEFEAMAQERDEYKAKLDALVAEQERARKVQSFVTELDNTEFADDTEVAEKLAELSEEQAEWALEKFRALSARIESDLTREIGDDTPAPANDRDALDIAIKAKAKEAGVDYNAAMTLVREEQPELFQ